jgi:hypothetical protein
MVDAAASLVHAGLYRMALLGQRATAYLAINLTMREPEEQVTAF